MFKKIDSTLIDFAKKISVPFSRFAIFLVYFWFGILKVIGASPANQLVMDLQAQTMPFLNFHQFIILFGLFEMLIGIIFLIKGSERLAIALLLIHLITTILPLIFLPQVTWQSFLIPTLEGQYILKNILIIAVAMGIVSHTQLRKFGNSV